MVSGFWFLVSGFWFLVIKPDNSEYYMIQAGCDEVLRTKQEDLQPETKNQKLWFYPFLCLPDEGHQRRHFVGGRGALQFVELGFGQAVPEIAHHVESLPPAVQYLEARPLVIAAGAAVAERHRPTQPGAAPLQVVPVRHRATF
jgi:hypothetical protein